MFLWYFPWMPSNLNYKQKSLSVVKAHLFCCTNIKCELRLHFPSFPHVALTTNTCFLLHAKSQWKNIVCDLKTYICILDVSMDITFEHGVITDNMFTDPRNSKRTKPNWGNHTDTGGLKWSENIQNNGETKGIFWESNYCQWKGQDMIQGGRWDKFSACGRDTLSPFSPRKGNLLNLLFLSFQD